MTTYIEYKLDNGATILIEADEQGKSSGLTQTSRRDKLGNVIEAASQTFGEAFSSVKKSASIIRQQLIDLRADEVEVTFGLKATGEAGNFAIGKVGMEANYMVTLKWSNKEKQTEDKQS